MLRILGKRQSINVRKVLWACDEIGLEYTQEDWGAGFRPTSDPAFRALSPKGLVPVLVDGDAVLTESNTIVRYLAAKHGRTDLLPSDPQARAQVEAAMDWQATEFNTAWRTAFLVLMRNRPDAGTPEQVEASIAEWTRMVALLDSQLADGRAFICGDTFTVADIVLGLSLHRWFRAPIQRADFPHVAAYYARLAERAAGRPHMAATYD